MKKVELICLLTACKHHKFKLFGDSSQVRAIDNGITCCYWSASLSNRLRALKAHSSLFKCCEKKNCPNYMYWIQGKHRGSWVWVFLRLFMSLKLIFTPQPSGLEGYCRHGPGGRAGGRAGGCQTCGTHISVTSWWIFSIRSSVELSRPVVVHCHGHLPICPIWACPWAKNLSNLAQIGSRLCGTHISETVGWIDPI